MEADSLGINRRDAVPAHPSVTAMISRNRLPTWK
jgi:hypothetical protein